MLRKKQIIELEKKAGKKLLDLRRRYNFELKKKLSEGVPPELNVGDKIQLECDDTYVCIDNVVFQILSIDKGIGIIYDLGRVMGKIVGGKTARLQITHDGKISYTSPSLPFNNPEIQIKRIKILEGKKKKKSRKKYSLKNYYFHNHDFQS